MSNKSNFILEIQKEMAEMAKLLNVESVFDLNESLGKLKPNEIDKFIGERTAHLDGENKVKAEKFLGARAIYLMRDETKSRGELGG